MSDLPSNVIPVKYTLKFEPDLQLFTFKGEESVLLEIAEDTNEIKLHALELTLQTVEVTIQGKPVPSKYEINEETNILTITLSEPIPAKTNDVILHTVFTHPLDDSLGGFYRSKYIGHDGKTEKYMAVTQMEPACARKTFPCWDVPSFKAVFAISLIVDKDLEALSNMPPKEEKELENNKKLYVFADTPMMSTYLVAFAVGEFEHISAKTKQGVTVRALSSPGNKHKLDFALKCGVFSLEFFTDYFNVPYPLPKCDLLAVNDFAAGAMENWGLITFRITALLSDESSSTAAKSRVAEVVSHELAHQWFGNLVTMCWWDNLWLNEGFATFLATFAVDRMAPQWEHWTTFVAHSVNSAFSLDSLKNTHPIQVPVKTVGEIQQIFDAISYEKSGAVLRMLYHYIGDEAFRLGLTDYLKKYSFKNAISDNLWECWSARAGKNVGEFMQIWTSQSGFPVVTVQQKDENNLLLSQTRFYANGEVEEKSPLWPIPICVRSDSDVYKESYLMTERELVIPSPGKGKYVKLNRDSVSMFHVRITDENMIKQFNFKELSQVDRISLLTDAIALSKAGLQSTAFLLTLLEKFEDEENSIVWSKISEVFASLRTTFRGDEEIITMLNKFGANLAAKQMKKLGWIKQEGESDLVTKMRAVIVSLSGRYDKETIAKAKEYLVNYEELSNDVLRVVYTTAVRNGGEKEYELVKEFFLNPDNAEELRVAVLSALGQNTDLMEQSLDWAFSGAVKNQDIVFLFGSCADADPPRLLKWYKAHFEEIKKKVIGVLFLGLRFVSLSLERINDEADFKDAKEFYEANPIPGAEMTLKQACESIQNRITWRRNASAQVIEWAKKH